MRSSGTPQRAMSLGSLVNLRSSTITVPASTTIASSCPPRPPTIATTLHRLYDGIARQPKRTRDCRHLLRWRWLAPFQLLEVGDDVGTGACLRPNRVGNPGADGRCATGPDLPLNQTCE